MDLIELIEAGLKANGLTGLISDNCCACSIEDGICPCDSPDNTCRGVVMKRVSAGVCREEDCDLYDSDHWHEDTGAASSGGR